jgi:hypothetical protein
VLVKRRDHFDERVFHERETTSFTFSIEEPVAALLY